MHVRAHGVWFLETLAFIQSPVIANLVAHSSLFVIFSTVILALLFDLSLILHNVFVFCQKVQNFYFFFFTEVFSMFSVIHCARKVTLIQSKTTL